MAQLLASSALAHFFHDASRLTPPRERFVLQTERIRRQLAVDLIQKVSTSAALDPASWFVVGSLVAALPRSLIGGWPAAIAEKIKRVRKERFFFSFRSFRQIVRWVAAVWR